MVILFEGHAINLVCLFLAFAHGASPAPHRCSVHQKKKIHAAVPHRALRATRLTAVQSVHPGSQGLSGPGLDA